MARGGSSELVSEDELGAQIARKGEDVRRFREELAEGEAEAIETAQSRRFITRIVLWTWLGSLAVYAGAASAGFAAANALLEIIKIAVLPLVTLVLGYYLSKAR